MGELLRQVFFQTLFVLKWGDEILGSSPSRLRHLDSAYGPGPGPDDSDAARSHYLELRDVAAVTAVMAMSPVRTVPPRVGRASP